MALDVASVSFIYSWLILDHDSNVKGVKFFAASVALEYSCWGVFQEERCADTALRLWVNASWRTHGYHGPGVYVLQTGNHATELNCVGTG